MNVRKAVLVGLAILAFALSGWMAWDFVGPYRWVSEAQASVGTNTYSPKLSFFIVLLVLLSPVIVLTKIWGLASIEEPGAPTPVNDYLKRFPRHAQICGLALMGLVGGGFIWTRAGSFGPLAHASLAEVESHPVSTSYVELTDYVRDLDHALEGGHSYYVPLRKPDGAPAMVFAKMTKGEFESESEQSLRGILREGDMENEARVVYEESGLLPAKYWVLDVNDSPDSQRSFGMLATLAGALLALGSVGYYLMVVRPTMRERALLVAE